MSILTEKKSWRREPTAFQKHRKARASLTPEQQANVRRALRHLLRRHGNSRARLAAAMGMSLDGYQKARTPSRPQTIGVGVETYHDPSGKCWIMLCTVVIL